MGCVSMRDARDYPNTIEFAAEKYYENWKEWRKSCLRLDEYYGNWNELNDDSKEPFKIGVIAVLNAVNYFENKTCLDCGNYDENNCGGFGICDKFVPNGVIE